MEVCHHRHPLVFPNEVINLLQQIAAKDPQAAATLDGVLPDPDKEELRSRQKQINGIRKLQQKIERKENAVQKREIQMTKFLEEIRVHVAQEKQRYQQDLATLRKEIADAKVQLQELKDGKEVAEAPMEEDLDALLDSDCPLAKENQHLKDQIKQMEQNSIQQQNQLYTMQSQMEDFLRRITDQQKEGTIAPATEVLCASIANGKPINLEDNRVAHSPQTAVTPTRPVVGPFRAAGSQKARNSPYQKGDELGTMDR